MNVRLNASEYLQQFPTTYAGYLARFHRPIELENPTALLPKLTLTEQDILCTLDLTCSAKDFSLGPDHIASKALKRLQDEQKLIALKRVYSFTHGDEHTARDRRKAEEVYTRYFDTTVKPRKTPWQQFKEFIKSLFLDPKSRDLYWFLGWLTSTRLFLLREHRVKPIPFLKQLFGPLSLSYIIEIIADIGVVIRSIFKKEKTETEKGLTPSQLRKRRFKNSINKDNRPYRLRNAIVWFAVNLTSYIFSFLLGGVPFAIANMACNLVGFSFDPLHESYMLWRDLNHYRGLLKKIDAKIDALHAQKHDITDPKRSLEMVKEIAALKVLRERTIGKRNEMRFNRIYDVVATTLILIGMILVFGASVFAPHIFLPGAIIALAAGSIAYGFGRRIARFLAPFVSHAFSHVKQFIFKEGGIAQSISSRFSARFSVRPSAPSRRVNNSHQRVQGKLNAKPRGDTPGQLPSITPSLKANPHPVVVPSLPSAPIPAPTTYPPTLTPGEVSLPPPLAQPVATLNTIHSSLLAPNFSPHIARYFDDTLPSVTTLRYTSIFKPNEAQTGAQRQTPIHETPFYSQLHDSSNSLTGPVTRRKRSPSMPSLPFTSLPVDKAKLFRDDIFIPARCASDTSSRSSPIPTMTAVN